MFTGKINVSLITKFSSGSHLTVRLGIPIYRQMLHGGTQKPADLNQGGGWFSIDWVSAPVAVCGSNGGELDGDNVC